MQFQPANSIDEQRSLESLVDLIATGAFNLFVDHLPDGLLVLDDSDLAIAINSPARTMCRFEEDVIGMPFGELIAISALEEESRERLAGEQNRLELLLHFTDGRSVLATRRTLRDQAGEKHLKLLFLRDLHLFDHQRRSASGVAPGNLFRFLSQRSGGPDFATQRQLVPELDALLENGSRALQQGARLLLSGESGSGKTEIARFLHRSIATAEEPFVHVNCAAIPESLFESEMFGYEKGTFTGALSTGKAGLIEAANGGTLFLDEVGEIPLSLQAKLLKFLEDGIVGRIGSRVEKKASVRIMSATNKDLWQLVDDRQFRSDLYYRLAVINLEVTPLRQHPPLIRHLVDYFLDRINILREPKLSLSTETVNLLCRYDYPGNIRELHNVIQQLSVMAGGIALPAHLPPRLLEHCGYAPGAVPQPGTDSNARPLKELVKEYETRLINQAIEEHGSKRKAADALGVNIGTIVRKTKQ